MQPGQPPQAGSWGPSSQAGIYEPGSSTVCAHLHLTLCNPMDCRPSGSSVHGILQARILERLPFPTPRDLPNPGIKPMSWQGDSLPLSHLGSLLHYCASISSLRAASYMWGGVGWPLSLTLSPPSWIPPGIIPSLLLSQNPSFSHTL